MTEPLRIAAPTPLEIDDTTAPFWAAAREHRLVIQRCQACGFYLHFPRPVCRRCRSFDLAFEEVSGRGTLYSFTETVKAFHPFFQGRTPYVVASVELAEQPGLQFLSNVVGTPAAELTFGAPVQVTFEERFPDLTVPVFEVVP